MLAETGNLAPESAYLLLRDYARSQGQHLSHLAHSLATGAINPRDLVAGHDVLPPR